MAATSVCLQHSAQRSQHVMVESRLKRAFSAQGDMLCSLHMIAEMRRTSACRLTVQPATLEAMRGRVRRKADTTSCQVHIVLDCRVLLHLDI